MTFFPSLLERLRPDEPPFSAADVDDANDDRIQDLDELCVVSANRRLPTHIAFSPSGFFSGTARIRMADGSARAIADVAVGERVMNRQGPDLVVEKLCKRLGKRQLFGLNGGEAFATADHAFYTLAGWRKLDPRAPQPAINSEGTRHLQVGDFVGAPRTGLIGPCAPLGPDGFALDFIFLNAITAADPDPDTKVFGLRLGRSRTCFVNDFLVLSLNDVDDPAVA